MKDGLVTAAILTHNEVAMIEPCLMTLEWCNSVVILDQHSVDKTVERAKNFGARVLISDVPSFAARRELLRGACHTEWILYIDADERVTPQLAAEIQKLVSENQADVGSFYRKNFFFGKNFKHGGWQGEVVTRLFRVSNLRGWQGCIHESPIFEGSCRQLDSELWHFSHRSVADGLSKSAMWTPLEAELLADSLPSRVSMWTIIRKGLGEVWRRGILHSGWQDGSSGSIEVLTQMINRMLVYMQVWERQQQPSIASRYQQLENEVKSLWLKSH